MEITISTGNIEVTIFPYKRGSGYVRLGALAQENRSTHEVERFLSLVRFKSREKLDELVTDGHNTT